MKLIKIFFKQCALWAVLAFPILANAANTFTLQQVIELAFNEHPIIRVSKAQEAAAIANVTTAKSFMNPQVEMGAGPSRYRAGSKDTRDNWGVAISQQLEFSDVRAARREIAETGVSIATLNAEIISIDLRSNIKYAFYQVLQRQEVLTLMEENRNLLNQIRERIKLRVDVGESPKYELIKADTEALAAERDYQSALVRVTEAKGYLQGLVGLSMPSQFELIGTLPLKQSLPAIDTLRDQIFDSPYLKQLRVINQSADAKLKLEQNLRNPGLTLRAGVEQDPDLVNFRLGLAVPLPLWNQRQGPIAEAVANIEQAQAQLSNKELSSNRDLISSYQRYLIAKNQLEAFESGLLSQAESVLKVAESAYKYGERGILEYLDAQRTYRVVKKDYLTARFDYVATMIEVERLVGTQLVGSD